MLKNISLTTQFVVVVLLVLGLTGGAFYLILDHVYINQLKNQAETVADNVEAFGSWVAQYGRVWVKDDDRSYLGHEVLLQSDGPDPKTAKLTPVNLYSKNPALAQREFSEAVERSASPAKFRLTSHNVMNPNNKPDSFEEGALEKIRSQGLKSYYRIELSTFRYARAVYHNASCIACHGDPASAPKDVKTRYGTEHGFGFKEGDVAGIVSVRLPAHSFWDVALQVVNLQQVLMVLTAFVIAMLFIRFSVVSPIKKLTAATEAISLGKPAELATEGLKPNTSNELGRLTQATDRLRVSIQMAMQRLQKKSSPD